MKIYTAHQITGLSPEQVIQYFEGTRDMLRRMGYEVLQPMTAKGFFRTEKDVFVSKDYGNPVSTNHAIFERDKWMVQNTDVVLVDLTDATQVSIGCIMELAIGAAAGKHTVVVMDEKNVHQHAFVKEAADIVLPDFKSAIEYLATFIHQDC